MLECGSGALFAPNHADPAIAPTNRVFAQFLKYATAGAGGTAVAYGILFALVELAAVRPVLASTCGAVAGAVVNYALNYRFTFQSSRPHREALAKYFTVAAAGIVLNAIVIALAMTVPGMHYFVAQLLATAVVLVAAFLTNRAWTF